MMRRENNRWQSPPASSGKEDRHNTEREHDSMQTEPLRKTGGRSTAFPALLSTFFPNRLVPRVLINLGGRNGDPKAEAAKRRQKHERIRERWVRVRMDRHKKRRNEASGGSFSERVHYRTRKTSSSSPLNTLHASLSRKMLQAKPKIVCLGRGRKMARKTEV